MKMPALTRLLLPLVSLALVACAAELDDADPTVTTPHPLEGTWDVRALEDAHTCPEFGTMAPVGPGSVTIVRESGGWWLSPRGSGEPVRYESAGDDRWERAVAGPYEGCELEADSEWVFDAVGERRFSSRYRASFRVFGEACGYPQGRCEVGYTVVGVRRGPAN